MKQILGRYASVIVTTIVFVALVVSVLGINIYLSFQTEANAEVVNIAGRQRMLSQRIAKSLSTVSNRLSNGQPLDDVTAELTSATELFDTTLHAFKSGGTTKSTKSGQATLQAVEQQAGIVAVDGALALWLPLQKQISAILTDLESDLGSTNTQKISKQITDAVLYADTNINSVLKLMNDLTNHTENIANQAADRSRTIQAAGILASLLCFGIILYLIFGQLRVSDLAAQSARQETHRIFETVSQGLFLVDKEGNTGSQRSKALNTIFGQAPEANQKFIDFIRPLVTGDDVSKVERYLALLFNPHKKQRLLHDLNPLNQLSVQIEERGQVAHKFLNFSFARVIQENEIVSILISVYDITKEVKLERELESESKRNQQQLSMVKVLLSADSQLLPEFLTHSNKAYNEINQVLRNPAKSSQDFRAKATDIFALIHKIKGESAAMGLDFVSEQCHEFESELERLTKLTSVGGDDFLSLAVMLERLITTNQQIDSVFDVVSSQRRSTQKTAQADPIQAPNEENVNEALLELAKGVAQRQGKQVSLSLAGFDNASLPSTTKLNIVSMASQLLRNALSHGIESPLARNEKGKEETGQVTLALFDEHERGLKLVCEDDGGGFDFEALAQQAEKSGLISRSEGKNATPGRLLNIAFGNKLSSKSDSDEDAGRGIGLNVIGDLANRLNGKISLQTRPNEGSRFIVRIPILEDQLSSDHESKVEVANG